MLKSRNCAIGLIENCLADEPEHPRKLAAGDRLLFYTDGITEAADAGNRLLGENRLAEIARETLSGGLFEMADTILNRVAEFRSGPPRDDITLIAVEIK